MVIHKDCLGTKLDYMVFKDYLKLHRVYIRIMNEP
jgi:hypothetical protein